MEWTWLIVALALLGLEAVTVSMVCIWFVGGAVGALIATLLGAPLWLQFTVFIIVSAVLLVAFRPLAKKMKPTHRTNSDSVVGKIVLVSEEINNLTETGAVRMSGVEWTARSVRDTVIPPQTRVIIRAIEGVKLFVEEV